MSISSKPLMFRVASPRVRPAQVDRENGIIRGFSVITLGEAIGHDLWIDEAMLRQVADHGNAKPNGLKSRFTHPGLSGDGMGKQLGRAKNFRVEANQVKADLHLYRQANQEYVETVLDLAEEDPAGFGTSIVFRNDYDEMSRHKAKHSDKDGKFQSPDSRNAKNLPHARLAELMAVDAVDDPAANPDGLFSDGSELPARAESLLAYAFGLSDRIPGEIEAGPHPARARAFMADFLQRRGLQVVSAGGDGDELGALSRKVDELAGKHEQIQTLVVNMSKSMAGLIELWLKVFKRPE